jgi:fructokinase
MGNESAAGERPVIFGEVLFDIFPDGSAVLGGAPFNVAWHLQGLGERPLVITRVGRDEQGDRVLDRMRAWNMDTSGVQRDEERATGRVEVSLEDAGPSYSIPEDQAFDAIDEREALPRLEESERWGLFYHGTLATRTLGGARTRKVLVEEIGLARFVDLNLREPWWSPASAARAMGGARILKLNADELAALYPRAAEGRDELIEQGQRLRGERDVETLVVTLGDDGAVMIDAGGGIHTAPAAQPEDFVDSVGAGDAFSAVMILGLQRGWPPARTLERAARFAGAVCGLRGATTDDTRIYDETRRAWEG